LKKNKHIGISLPVFLITLVSLAGSCTHVDLFEKTVAIPGHQWKSDFKPSFTFEIKDSSAMYQVWLVMRHTEKYNFNNIYLNLSAMLAGQDTVLKVRRDINLASNEGGWKGTGMDDIYEHRLALGEPQQLKPGTYTFTLEQIMREDPLAHVMNVGLRIEKIQ
jgi:gliding motility-associated lipoprotein GldH